MKEVATAGAGVVAGQARRVDRRTANATGLLLALERQGKLATTPRPGRGATAIAMTGPILVHAPIARRLNPSQTP